MEEVNRHIFCVVDDNNIYKAMFSHNNLEVVMKKEKEYLDKNPGKRTVIIKANLGLLKFDN